MHPKTQRERELYEVEMGARTAERQEQILEQFERCNCSGTGGWHEPDCNRTKGALLRGKR